MPHGLPARNGRYPAGTGHPSRPVRPLPLRPVWHRGGCPVESEKSLPGPHRTRLPGRLECFPVRRPAGVLSARIAIAPVRRIDALGTLTVTVSGTVDSPYHSD